MIYLRHTVLRAMSATSLALVAMLLVYLLIDGTEHIRILLAYKADHALLLDLALARLPLATVHLLPLALLLGCLSVMSDMARDREILALAASGQGLVRRLAPFVVCGLFVALATWGLSETLAPASEARYHELVDIEIKKKHRWGAKWRPHRAWYAGPSGLWRVGAGQGSDLHDVTLFRLDSELGYTVLEQAQRMRHDGEQWQVENWRRVDVLGREKEGTAEEFVVSEQPEHFRMIWSQAEEMTRHELKEAILLRQAQGLEADGYRTELAMRTALPLLCLVLPLLLPTVAWRPSRIGHSRGRLAVLGSGVGLGLAVFLLLSIGRALAVAGLVCAPLALFSVPAGLALLAPILLRRVRV